MTLNDPTQPYYPVKHREQPPPDPLREFGAEYPNRWRNTTAPRQPPAMLGLCLFENGREVRRGRDCPHFREADSDLP